MWLSRHAWLVMTRCEALETMYQQRRMHSCCGLAKTPMVNDSEPVINPVNHYRRNAVLRLAKIAKLPVDIIQGLMSFQP